jgi:hypothetical protein
MRRWFFCSIVLISIAVKAQTHVPVSPSIGSGANRVFTLSGPAAILINSSLNTRHACYAEYDAQKKLVSLRNDTGDGWASSGVPGSPGVLGNNQCSIDLQRSSILDAKDPGVSLAIAFQPNFAGAKTVWTKTGKGGWQAVGKWSAQAVINLGAPAWSPIMTPPDPPQYFKYDGTSKIETDAAANRTALPYHFRTPNSPANDPSVLSGICSFSAERPPYWYDFAGNRLAGKFKSVMPSEYFVSRVPSDAGFGLQLRAAFGGAASGPGVLYETAYFHQQACDNGGLEFGFFRNVPAAQTVFYLSNNSNCGIQPNGYCHVSDSFSSDFMNEDNEPGRALTTNLHGWEIKNLNVKGAPAQLSELYYSVFILPDRSAAHGRRFQVEVFDPTTAKHANCDVVDTAGNTLFVNKPCGFPVRPGAWFTIDELYQDSAVGYVTVGVQRQGNPGIGTTIDFDVQQVNVPK